MRFRMAIGVVLGLASSAFAKDPKLYQTGDLLRMDAVECAVPKKNSATTNSQSNGEIASRQSQDLRCQEYILQTERVTYHLRPRDAKYPTLLPVGERTQFRFQKNKLLLRDEQGNGKEHQYVVVSMSPRSDADSATAIPARINHLQ